MNSEKDDNFTKTLESLIEGYLEMRPEAPIFEIIEIALPRFQQLVMQITEKVKNEQD